MLASLESSAAIEREELARDVLASLGPIRLPDGSAGLVRYVPVHGGGWCFYDACLQQMNLGGNITMESLACAALTFLARRRHEVRQFTPLEDIDEMKSAVSRISKYSGHIEDLAAFDIYGLDKM